MNMNLDRLFNLLGAIVTVALVTTILMRGSAAAQVVTSLANGFSSAIRNAQGR